MKKVLRCNLLSLLAYTFLAACQPTVTPTPFSLYLPSQTGEISGMWKQLSAISSDESSSGSIVQQGTLGLCRVDGDYISYTLKSDAQRPSQDACTLGVLQNNQSTNVRVTINIQAELKDFPAGLILRGKTDDSFCDIPRGFVDGAYCQISWEDLEPEKGSFNFSLIDEALVKAAAYNVKHRLSGKDQFKIMLRIRTGVSSPNWVSQEVGSIDWYFRNLNKGNTLPLFWEQPYQDRYNAMMKKLAARYDSNPLIGGVAASMCTTFHSETMWNRTGRPEVRAINMKTMRDAKNGNGVLSAYTNEKDFSCLQRQVRIHKEHWEKTPTLFGSHLYQEYSYETGNATSISSKAVELFDYCRAPDQLYNRCVLGNHNLTHYKTLDGSINGLLVEQGGPVYFQTAVFQDGVGSKELFGFEELNSSLFLGILWGAFLVELPMGWDCEDVHGKTGCTEQLAEQRSEQMADARVMLKGNVEAW